MKKIAIFSICLVLFTSFSAFVVDCDKLIFFKEGVKTTMTHYNDDGKVIGSTKMTCTKIEKAGNTTTMYSTNESYDKKGKLASTAELKIKCINGTLIFDLKGMMPQQQADAYKDFDITVEGLEKEVPQDLAVGAVLKDANVKFTVSAKGGAPMPMMNMTVNTTNRKVEAKESITTAAGTFDCFKITEDTELKTLFKMKTKNVVWFSQEAGVIKSESYKENGKLVSRSELTEIVK